MISSSDILAASILIVDDRDANITLLEKMLRGAGYVTITSTRNSHDVCELHRQNNYSLILLDLQMPGMDGFQVMDRLKAIETGGYLPVLVITAQPDHKLRALQAGAKDFVSKPLDLAEVLMRVRNMIEVRLLHRETRRLNDQLQTSNEELEAFSYSVSHDLRAPLRHVAGFVELLKIDADPVLSEASRHYLATISKSAKRMEKLIDDLLAFSRLGRAELQKGNINLNDLVTETLTDLQSETKERNIVWKIDPLPEVRVERSLLRQVIVNLLTNAIKFTRERSPANIEIGCAAANDKESIIFVRDNGAGFDPKHTSKLFGVFQRLHSSSDFEGTGIGLANVQRIIQRHGGRVWAEGAVGQGAMFCFSIPKEPKEA